jgi:hypothetical protein
MIYDMFGEINGTAFRETWTCSPAGESAPSQDNSKVQISADVIRKGVSGEFWMSSIKSRRWISRTIYIE